MEEFEIFDNDTRKFKTSVRSLHEMVYDQYEEPICYACAMATATTIAYRLKYGIQLDMSPQSLVNKCVYKLSIMRRHMVEIGLLEHCDDPFIHVRKVAPLNRRGYKYPLKDLKSIVGFEKKKAAIKYNFGPWGPKYALLASIDTTNLSRRRALAAWDGAPFSSAGPHIGDDDEWESSYSDDEETHAVVLTGLDTSVSLYDDDHAIELKNSYGKGWGKDGYTRVTYDSIETLEIPVLLGDCEDMEERHHQLELNAFIGGVKSVKDTCFSYEYCLADDTAEWDPVLINGICFSGDGNLLAAACEDGLVRIFHLADASSESLKCTRCSMPEEYDTNQIAVAVAFANNGSSLVVACKSPASSGTFINTYDKDASNGGDAGREFRLVCQTPESHHDHHLVALYASKASDRDDAVSTILATSSGGTDIWGGTRTFEEKLGSFGNPAIISPDGKFIAAATSEHAVKVWKCVTDANATRKQVKEHTLLEGHQAAVTCMCFTPDMKIISASLDGTLRVSNIYGPNPIEPWKRFPHPRQNSKETQLHYNCVAMSPDRDSLAVSQGNVLQWLSVETGEVIDTAENAHEGVIISITWSPKRLFVGGRLVNVLATVGHEKKLKLWKAPTLSHKFTI